jgi:hypothetical protein
MSIYDAKANDWEAKSYVDFGLGALIAGYACHLRFTSKTLKITVDGVYLGMGFGIGAEVDLGGGTATAIDKLMGASDFIPSVGDEMKVQHYRPFSVNDLRGAPCAILTAGVAAIVAPADVKCIRLGDFCVVIEAKGTLKLAIGVGANVTGGFYSVTRPAELSVWDKQYLGRKSATDPISGPKQ